MTDDGVTPTKAGYTRAMELATSVSVSFAGSDLTFCDEAARAVFADMWSEACPPDSAIPDRDRLAIAFRHVVVGMATMLDAAHESMGYVALEEKLEALHSLAMIGENASHAPFRDEEEETDSEEEQE